MPDTDHPESVEDLVQVLRPAIGRIRRGSREFPATGRHFLPDLLLLGLVKDVVENADAVLVLATNPPVSHRTWPSVRASFEAAQIALLLATAEDYDWEGALGWTYYLLQDDRLISQAGKADVEASVEGPETDYDGFEGQVEYWAAQWEDFFPGAGSLIQRAAQDVTARPSRRNNYLNVNVASELEKRLKRVRSTEKSGRVASLFRVNYGLLSREAHPSPRFQPRSVALHPTTDRLSFDEEEDPSGDRLRDALTVTAGACNLAAIALAHRQLAVLDEGD